MKSEIPERSDAKENITAIWQATCRFDNLHNKNATNYSFVN